MTPHYDWTPASEPPDTSRMVLVWATSDMNTDGAWFEAVYLKHKTKFFIDEWDRDQWTVTHWRDVAPPDVEAPK